MDEFREDVAAAARFLSALQKKIPKWIDQKTIDYLVRLETDPVGLEMLYNSLEWAETP